MPRPRRRTGGKSSLLEDCVHSLTMVGFQVYENPGHYQAAEIRPGRCVVRNYAHPSLYGTPGRKEAYIEADGRQFILEAKWQESAGSVDEKLPYIWHAFLISPVTSWIVVLDGDYWRKNQRAQAGVRWLRAQSPPAGRELLVFTRKEFYAWAREQWSNGLVPTGSQWIRAEHQAKRDRRPAGEEDPQLLFGD